MSNKARGLVAPVSHRGAHFLRRLRYALTQGERESPTYAIVGAKRAGTSSLNEYIVRHPHALRGLVEKGCRYFDVNYHRGHRWFERQLPPRSAVDRLEAALGQRPIFGESSPYYSFHPFAIERMARDLPDARLILLTRDPIERAWSHYRYEVARGFETLPFVRALAAEENRLGDPNPVVRAFAHRHHSYAARGRYGAMVSRMLRHYPREAVLVVKSEALFNDPAATMNTVFAHLGLTSVTIENYPVIKGQETSQLPRDGADWLAGRFDIDDLLLRSAGVAHVPQDLKSNG